MNEFACVCGGGGGEGWGFVAFLGWFDGAFFLMKTIGHLFSHWSSFFNYFSLFRLFFYSLLAME